MVRLLFIIGSLEVGGAERHLLRITSDLVKAGYEVQVFAFRPEGPLGPAFSECGVQVRGIRAPSWLSRLIPQKRLLSRVCLLISIPYLLRVLWGTRPNIIHFFLPIAYIVGSLVSMFGPQCIRIMSRRSLNNYQLKRPFLAKVERWLHPRMDMITGNSKAVVEQLVEEGSSRDQLRLIYNGIDVDQFNRPQARNKIRKQLGINNASLVMIMVANLIPYKGHSDLIRAFATIKNSIPNDWVVLLVGRDDGIQSSLESLAREVDVFEHLRFLGSRKDIPDLLSASDIGILSSHQEGFSNAILEAMAAGLPMVVTDVGGNAEAVLHEETGLVVPSEQPTLLGEALLNLALREDRQLMGYKGQVSVTTKFSSQACLDGYEALYKDALAHRAI